MHHASSSNTLSSLLQQSLHAPRVFRKHVVFVTSNVSESATCLPQTRSLRYLNRAMHATGNTGMSNITGHTRTRLAMGKTNGLGTSKQTYKFLFQFNSKLGRWHNWNGLNDLFGAYELTVRRLKQFLANNNCYCTSQTT